MAQGAEPQALAIVAVGGWTGASAALKKLERRPFVVELRRCRRSATVPNGQSFIRGKIGGKQATGRCRRERRSRLICFCWKEKLENEFGPAIRGRGLLLLGPCVFSSAFSVGKSG